MLICAFVEQKYWKKPFISRKKMKKNAVNNFMSLLHESLELHLSMILELNGK